MGPNRLPSTRRALHTLALMLAVPVAAAAQTPPKGPNLPRVDVYCLVGRVGAQVDDLPGSVYRDWDSTGIGSLGAGFYITEHVKVEADYSGWGTRELYGSVQQESSRAGSRSVYQEHHVRARTLSVTGLYQLLHNTWVHPFVGVGLDVDWERRLTETWVQTTISNPPVFTSTTENLPDAVAHDQRLRGALMTGVKLYVTPRTFVRTEVRVSFGNHVNAVRWRIGAGLDF